jgi:hypothetical protein
MGSRRRTPRRSGCGQAALKALLLVLGAKKKETAAVGI